MRDNSGPQAETFPTAHAPLVVYFWGEVRDHVNRIALEYARRIPSPRAWLDVRTVGDLPDGRIPASVIAPEDRFTLPRGEPVRRHPRSPTTARRGTPEKDGRTLRDGIEEILDVPAAVDQALAHLESSAPGGILVLTNIDRVGELGLLTDPAIEPGLLRSLQEHDVTLVVTSVGLLHSPRLPMECAFHVSSQPGEEWWESEVWPGVPVSACSTCSDSLGGQYAACAPHLSLACPYRYPFEGPREEMATPAS